MAVNVGKHDQRHWRKDLTGGSVQRSVQGSESDFTLHFFLQWFWEEAKSGILNGVQGSCWEGGISTWSFQRTVHRDFPRLSHRRCCSMPLTSSRYRALVCCVPHECCFRVHVFVTIGYVLPYCFIFSFLWPKCKLKSNYKSWKDLPIFPKKRVLSLYFSVFR